MNEPVVIMTYQEKIWYDLVEQNPEFVMWTIGVLVAALAVWAIIVATEGVRSRRRAQEKWDIYNKFSKFNKKP